MQRKDSYFVFLFLLESFYFSERKDDGASGGGVTLSDLQAHGI